MHPVNVEVRLREGESIDKMIKRFFKKCKKQDILKEHLEKISFHRTKSQKRRDKIQKNRHLRRVEELKAQKKFRKV
jgi:ribosomal protein S21